MNANECCGNVFFPYGRSLELVLLFDYPTTEEVSRNRIADDEHLAVLRKELQYHLPDYGIPAWTKAFARRHAEEKLKNIAPSCVQADQMALIELCQPAKHIIAFGSFAAESVVGFDIPLGACVPCQWNSQAWVYTAPSLKFMAAMSIGEWRLIVKKLKSKMD